MLADGQDVDMEVGQLLGQKRYKIWGVKRPRGVLMVENDKIRVYVRTGRLCVSFGGDAGVERKRGEGGEKNAKPLEKPFRRAWAVDVGLEPSGKRLDGGRERCGRRGRG